MIDNSWGSEIISLGKRIMDEIISEKKSILPKEELVFRALSLPFDKVKVLIIGQDPYPNAKDACGLAFSSPSGIPGSLKTIFETIGIAPKTGDLTSWAEQGVLLLNRALTLTVTDNDKEQSKYLTINLKRWKPLINMVIDKLLNEKKALVIMLWGNPSNKVIPYENDEELKKRGICILRSSHPSNLGKNKSLNNGKIKAFVNTNHFNECNDFLREHACKEINWNIV